MSGNDYGKLCSSVLSFFCLGRRIDITNRVLQLPEQRRLPGLGPDGVSHQVQGVFSEDFKIFRTLAFLSFPSVFQCVYTHQAGRKPALQQNWQSSEKSQNFKEKTQYLMNTQ